MWGVDLGKQETPVRGGWGLVPPPPLSFPIAPWEEGVCSGPQAGLRVTAFLGPGWGVWEAPRLQRTARWVRAGRKGWRHPRQEAELSLPLALRAPGDWVRSHPLRPPLPQLLEGRPGGSPWRGLAASDAPSPGPAPGARGGGRGCRLPQHRRVAQGGRGWQRGPLLPSVAEPVPTVVPEGRERYRPVLTVRTGLPQVSESGAAGPTAGPSARHSLRRGGSAGPQEDLGHQNPSSLGAVP